MNNNKIILSASRNVKENAHIIIGELFDDVPKNTDGSFIYAARMGEDGNVCKLSNADKRINPMTLLNVDPAVYTKYFRTQIPLDHVFGMDIDGDFVIVQKTLEHAEMTDVQVGKKYKPLYSTLFVRRNVIVSDILSSDVLGPIVCYRDEFTMLARFATIEYFRTMYFPDFYTIQELSVIQEYRRHDKKYQHIPAAIRDISECIGKPVQIRDAWYDPNADEPIEKFEKELTVQQAITNMETDNCYVTFNISLDSYNTIPVNVRETIDQLSLCGERQSPFPLYANAYEFADWRLDFCLNDTGSGHASPSYVLKPLTKTNDTNDTDVIKFSGTDGTYTTTNSKLSEMKSGHFNRDEFTRLFVKYIGGDETVLGLFEEYLWGCDDHNVGDFRIWSEYEEVYILHMPSGIMVGWYKMYHYGRSNFCNREDFTHQDLEDFLVLLRKQLIEEYDIPDEVLAPNVTVKEIDESIYRKDDKNE